MRNYARFIPGEEIEAVEQWQFGAVDTVAQLRAAQAKAREAQDEVAHAALDHQQAFQDGYAQGLEQGKLQEQVQLQQQMQDFLRSQASESAARFTQLFESAQRQLQEAEQAMAQGVLALACEVARQVVRRELTVSTDTVLPVLTEALGLLSAEHKAAVIKLHPQDLEALGERIQANAAGLQLTLRAEPELLPGGCLVESAGTVVDGSLPKRWQRAVASLGLSSSWETPGEPS